MKSAKKFLTIALAVGTLATLTGCSKRASSPTPTSANWNINTSTTFEKDENNLNFWRTHKEVATYAVTFEKGNNTTYAIDYKTQSAKYSTEFYVEDYNWTDANIPEAYRYTGEDASKKSEPVYVYKTSLMLEGTVTVAGTGETKTFNDLVTTVNKFRMAGDNLKPVYSEQQINNTAPAILNATSINDATYTLNAVYTTYYNRECTQAHVTTTKRPENTDTEKTISLTSKEGYSVFDNAQLKAVARAFTMSGNKTFNVCVPQNGNLQTCVATCQPAIELKPSSKDENGAVSENDQIIIDALANVTDNNGNKVNDYIFFDGTPTEKPQEGETAPTAKNIRYNQVTFSILAELSGGSSVYWYSTVENPDLNATRSVMLKMQTPLGFAIGNLNYSLSKLEVVNV